MFHGNEFCEQSAQSRDESDGLGPGRQVLSMEKSIKWRGMRCSLSA